jgi:DNA-binding transcriptional MerR regulator
MKIQEVSKKYGVSEDTLRYYEKEGLIPGVPRTEGQIRNYDQASCNWIEFITCMRNAGLSIESLKEYVRLFRQGDSTIAMRKELLEEERRKLEQRIALEKATLKRLDLKISHYETSLSEYEKHNLK